MQNPNDAFIIERQPVLPIEPPPQPKPSWWIEHWTQLSCGAGIIACYVGGVFIPPLIPLCSTVTGLLTAAGFFTSAQSSVVNKLSEEVANATRKTIEISKQVNFVTKENATVISQVNKNSVDIKQAMETPFKRVPCVALLCLVAGALTACSGAQVAKADAILVRIHEGAKVALVTGCKNLPAVEVGVVWLESIIPKDQIVQGGIVALQAIDPLAKRLCAVIQGLPEQQK